MRQRPQFRLFALFMLAATSLCSAASPPALILLDENHPPFSYHDAEGNAQGLSLELCRLLVTELQWPTKIELSSWARVESRLKAGEPVLIGAMMKTPERTPHYQWLLQLFAQENLIYRLRERRDELPVQTLNDLNRYRIGTVARSGSYQQLLQVGVQAANIDTVNHGLQNLDKLLRQRIDFMTAQPAMMHYFARHHRVEFSRFEPALTLADSSEFYLSANLSAPAVWGEQLRTAWRQLERQQQFKAIRQQYRLQATADADNMGELPAH